MSAWSGLAGTEVFTDPAFGIAIAEVGHASSLSLTGKWRAARYDRLDNKCGSLNFSTEGEHACAEFVAET